MGPNSLKGLQCFHVLSDQGKEDLERILGPEMIVSYVKI